MSSKAIRVEEWRQVFGGIYEISNTGRLRRAVYSSGCIAKNHILAPSLDADRYLQYVVCVNGKRSCHKAHRLVALAFIGPCPDGKQVNHIDAVKANNSPANLEYVTHLEQQRHRVKTVPINWAVGERHGSKTHPEAFPGRRRRSA